MREGREGVSEGGRELVSEGREEVPVSRVSRALLKVFLSPTSSGGSPSTSCLQREQLQPVLTCFYILCILHV